MECVWHIINCNRVYREVDVLGMHGCTHKTIDKLQPESMWCVKEGYRKEGEEVERDTAPLMSEIRAFMLCRSTNFGSLGK